MSTCRPLFKIYKGQTSPQRAFLEINQKGEISEGYSGDISGYTIPMSVYNKIDLRYDIPESIYQSEINDLIEQIKPLAEKLTKESEFFYNSNASYVRKLTREGELISSQIEEIIENYDYDDETEGCWICGCEYCYRGNEGDCMDDECKKCGDMVREIRKELMK